MRSILALSSSAIALRTSSSSFAYLTKRAGGDDFFSGPGVSGFVISVALSMLGAPLIFTSIVGLSPDAAGVLGFGTSFGGTDGEASLRWGV
jgi:hypothetical protein